MLIVIYVLAIFICNGQTDTAGLHQVIALHLSGVAQKVEKLIVPGRYMCTGNHAKLIGTTDTISGWEGYPIQLYEYSVKDKKDSVLTARVYLLNASAERIARWVIAADYMVNGRYNEQHADTIIHYINDASNAQFVVRGIVYEDMDGDDIQDAYLFFDGVTVKHKDYPVITPQRATAAEQQLLLSMTIADIAQAKLYGRIISTTREQYNALFPQTGTQGNEWCNVIREEYKKALHADINWLIHAWVKANPQYFK